MDINNFGPFHASTWGTVADCVTSVVTLVTIYFFYQTLTSQLKVQKQQQVITEIEIRRYLDSIKPDLKAELYHYREIEGMKSFDLRITPIVNVLEKFAYEFTQPPLGFIDRTNFKFDDVTFQLDSPFHIFFSWEGYHDSHGLVAGLKCYVQDKIGTRYEILFMILNEEGLVRKVGPTLISYPSLMDSIK